MQQQPPPNTNTDPNLVNEEYICKALEALSNPNLQLRSQAEEFLGAGEKNIEFPFVLLRIIKSNNASINLQHKMQSSLCLKNYVNIHWNKRCKVFEKKAILNEQIRASISQEICQMLRTQIPLSLRRPFNEMISIITKSGFPNNAREFYEYAKDV